MQLILNFVLLTATVLYVAAMLNNAFNIFQNQNSLQADSAPEFQEYQRNYSVPTANPAVVNPYDQTTIKELKRYIQEHNLKLTLESLRGKKLYKFNKQDLYEALQAI